MKDGGPAFPCSNVQIGTPVSGMSLRDYFAGQAIAGICTATDESGYCTWDTNAAAKLAYEVAEAMLSERERTRP